MNEMLIFFKVNSLVFNPLILAIFHCFEAPLKPLYAMKMHHDISFNVVYIFELLYGNGRILFGDVSMKLHRQLMNMGICSHTRAMQIWSYSTYIEDI